MKYLILILPVFIYAQNLKSLLDYADNNSDIVVSKNLTKQAKNIAIDSRKSDYYPTIDIGANFQSVNDRTPFQAGDVYNAYVKLSFDIYDGGKKSALLKQSKNEYKASDYETKATKKSLSLQIVQDFFNIKSLEASLSSRDEAKKSISEQLIRMQRFLIAKVATKDDVDRLQSAYDTNAYEMESIKLQILSLKKSLELKVSKNINKLENSKFKTFQEHEMQTIDSLKSLMAKKEAIVNNADSIDSIYYPQIKLEDTYNVNEYDRSDDFHFEGPDKQNKLLVSLNLRLFDMASISKSKQSVILESQAINALVIYNKKEQQMNYEIALISIKTSKIKIKSALSALTSASSAFKTISKKYDAGIVDNVTYLDALSAQTSAKALYETSLNDLQIAYAAYYFYAGKDIKEFL